MNAAIAKAWIPVWLRPAPNSMSAFMHRAGYSPKWQAFNLLWSLWVFCAPLFTDVGVKYWWSLGISYVIFLLLFWLVHVRPYAETRLYSGAMLLLACVNLPFNPAAWSYGVFACIYVPYFGTLMPSVFWIVTYELLMVVVGWWLGWPWFIELVLVGVCSSAGFGAMIGKVNGKKANAERLSMEEVRRLAAGAERERIGRDLHDLLGHTLSLITLKLELSRKLFDRDPEQARRELTEAEKVARHALAEVRAAVTGIRATGLVGELASARLMLRTSGVELVADAMPSLPDAIDEVLALALREAVINIHRHARASHAQISVEVADGHAHMRVHDDGRGGIGHSGNGLAGMRERVEALGGALSIRSLPGQGTALTIDIPLLAATTPTWPVAGDQGGPAGADVVSFPRQAGGKP